MHCDICGRRMQGQWNHGTADYRCKYPADYPEPEGGHPRSVYVKEADVTPGLDQWLAQLFDDDHIEHTQPDPRRCLPTQPRSRRPRRSASGPDSPTATCASRSTTRSSTTTSPSPPAGITEAQRERRGLEAELGQQVPGEQLSSNQVKALVHALRNIVDTLAAAEPADKADLYRELGVTLRYDPSGTVTVQAQPRGVTVRVGGATAPATTWPTLEGELSILV